jgi:hypothetical protein
MITNFNNFNNFSGKMGELEENTSQQVIQTAQKNRLRKKRTCWKLSQNI